MDGRLVGCLVRIPMIACMNGGLIDTCITYTHAHIPTYVYLCTWLSKRKCINSSLLHTSRTHTPDLRSLTLTPPPTYVVVMPTQLAIPMHAHKEIHSNVLGAWKSIFLLDVLKNKPWPRSTLKRKITSFPKKKFPKVILLLMKMERNEGNEF